MANEQLKNDMVAWIPVWTIDDAGDRVPAPTGDAFTIVSSDPTKIVAAMGVMPSGPQVGAVAYSLTPMVKLAPGIGMKLTDTAALKEEDLIWDVVADVTPSTIKSDLVDTVFVPQAVPAA